jgi:P27 family predicted phage terminase small subunit
MKGRKPLPADCINPADFKKSKTAVKHRKQAEKKLVNNKVLRCPSYISDGAKREWRRIMEQYAATDAEILCGLDTQALVMYCEATAIYRKAEETWSKISNDQSGETSIVLEDRCVEIMTEQSKIIKGLLEQLCLSPVGRARMALNAPKKNEPSKLQKLLAD